MFVYQAAHAEPLPQVDEEAYRRMFPKDDQQAPVSSSASAAAPSAALQSSVAPPTSNAFSFLSAGNSTSSTPATATAPSAAPAPAAGSYESALCEPSWRARLQGEFSQPYWKTLMSFLDGERTKGVQILPPQDEVFSALNLCPFDSVRVVLLGQDPYHDIGQAHGLCFSVKPGVPPPPSLKNIYKEIKSDLGIDMPSHGTLVPWAQRGVLLLNACLTGA